MEGKRNVVKWSQETEKNTQNTYTVFHINILFRVHAQQIESHVYHDKTLFNQKVGVKSSF